VRIIEGQKTLMARTTHDIAVDSIHDEIVAPNPFAEAILFFRGGANGEEPPIRVIQGPKTKLTYDDTDNVIVDPQHSEVFTAQGSTNSIFVFNREAKGDVEPVRIIRGSKTKLNRPARVAVDPINNLLVVSNTREPKGLLIFNRTDNGDVAPRAIISGPKTSMIGSPSRVTLYPEGKKIFVAVSGKPSREKEGGAFIGIWKYEDNGNVPPWAIIRSTAVTKLRSSYGGVALNPEAKEVMVVDNAQPPALLIYHLPEAF
jgi:DNA-binding beta-propeller fold protein YncE